MSMSTKIEDLPGPIPEDILGDINTIKNENSKEHFDNGNNREDFNDKIVTDNSNIKMNIKKVRFSESSDADEAEHLTNTKEMGFMDFIKNLLNEENIVLFVLFLLSSQTDYDRYPKSIPFFGNYLENPLIFTLIKCILLIIVFVITKLFIIPKIKL